jgi:hypothetical protein
MPRGADRRGDNQPPVIGLLDVSDHCAPDLTRLGAGCFEHEGMQPALCLSSAIAAELPQHHSVAEPREQARERDTPRPTRRHMNNRGRRVRVQFFLCCHAETSHSA